MFILFCILELLPEDQPIFNSNGTELNTMSETYNDDTLNNSIKERIVKKEPMVSYGTHLDTELTSSKTIEPSEPNEYPEYSRSHCNIDDTLMICDEINTNSEAMNINSETPRNDNESLKYGIETIKNGIETIKNGNETLKNDPITTNNKQKKKRASRKKDLSEKLKEMFGSDDTSHDDSKNNTSGDATVLTADAIKKETVTVSPTKTIEPESPNYVAPLETKEDVVVLNDVVVNEIPLNLDLGFQSDNLKMMEGDSLEIAEEEVEEEEDEEEDGGGE